jgi:hypothetical protein
MVGRWPVLIDFERSILEEGEVRSAQSSGSVPNPGTHRWSIDRLPVWLRSLWNPPNRAAARNVELLLSLLPGPSPLVLVIGGGTMGNGVDAIYADRRTRVVGFDTYSSPLTQFIADAHRIPVASESVDAVLIQAVLEHVLDPGQVVSEIQRVLRNGGSSMRRPRSYSRCTRVHTTSSATPAAVTGTCSGRSRRSLRARSPAPERSCCGASTTSCGGCCARSSPESARGGELLQIPERCLSMRLNECIAAATCPLTAPRTPADRSCAGCARGPAR